MHQESPRTVSIRPTLSHARLLFRQLLQSVDPLYRRCRRIAPPLLSHMRPLFLRAHKSMALVAQSEDRVPQLSRMRLL